MTITAINYLNTVPMIYGIEHGGIVPHGGLRIAVPSACADAAKAHQTDIALVPVAEVPSIVGGRIITDFCISASGAVDTVALLSDTPLRDIHTIHLDWHSRTSVQLVRILASELWGNYDRIEWVESSADQGLSVYDRELPRGHAVLAIGDKVFGIQGRYLFKTDLALEWRRLTGLPFVFAVWVAVTDDGVAYEQTLNQALSWGVAHIDDAIRADKKGYDFALSHRYLTQNIQFNLTDSGRKAIKLFWEKIITPG